MYTTEKSRRVLELEKIEVENALKKLEKYKKLFSNSEKQNTPTK